jgi:hypothetical protein
MTPNADTSGPLGRRIARQRAAEAAAIGRPTVYAPKLASFTVSPFVQRARSGQLPAKEYGR